MITPQLDEIETTQTHRLFCLTDASHNMYSFQDGGRGMRTVTPQDSAGVKYEDFQSVCQIELREIAKDSCGSNSTHINLLFGHKKTTERIRQSRSAQHAQPLL